MEEQKLERDLMSQQEFEKYLEDNRRLVDYSVVSKYKSVKRAMKRGHLNFIGIILPRRPYNNRANTSNRRFIHSRKNNELKRSIYKTITYGRETV